MADQDQDSQPTAPAEAVTIKEVKGKTPLAKKPETSKGVSEKMHSDITRETF